MWINASPKRRIFAVVACEEDCATGRVNQRKTFTMQTATVYDTPCARHARATERKVLGSEVWQFLTVISGFLVAAVLWLFVVYLPGRTLERWEDQRPGRGKAGPSAGSGSPDVPSKPES
jgi:hypothetical protein